MLAGEMALGVVRKKYKHMPWRPYKKFIFLYLTKTFLHFVEKTGENECNHCILSTKDIKKITFFKAEYFIHV